MTAGSFTAPQATPTSSRPSPGAAIASVGVSLPAQVVSNAAVAERLGRDPQWIERRTGIRSRRIAEPDESLTEHAATAG